MKSTEGTVGNLSSVNLMMDRNSLYLVHWSPFIIRNSSSGTQVRFPRINIGHQKIKSLFVLETRRSHSQIATTRPFALDSCTFNLTPNQLLETLVTGQHEKAYIKQHKCIHSYLQDIMCGTESRAKCKRN